jgi:hypothetical protein
MKNKFNTCSLEGLEKSRIGSPSWADGETAIITGIDIPNINILEVYYFGRWINGTTPNTILVIHFDFPFKTLQQP